MIVSVYSDDGFIETEGCGCCSDRIYLRDNNKNQVEEHIIDNINVAVEAAQLCGIDIKSILLDKANYL